MAELLTFENLGNLAVLIFLQAVLGFDNLLYISIESQRAPKESQAKVRQMGIIIAVALRIVLLFVMVSLIDSLKDPFKEIHHMLSVHDLQHEGENKSSKSATQVILLIVFMNLIFSFDSILSAIAITDVFPILAIAILASGAAMLILADGVAAF